MQKASVQVWYHSRPFCLEQSCPEPSGPFLVSMQQLRIWILMFIHPSHQQKLPMSCMTWMPGSELAAVCEGVQGITEVQIFSRTMLLFPVGLCKLANDCRRAVIQNEAIDLSGLWRKMLLVFFLSIILVISLKLLSISTGTNWVKLAQNSCNCCSVAKLTSNLVQVFAVPMLSTLYLQYSFSCLSLAQKSAPVCYCTESFPLLKGCFGMEWFLPGF